MDGDLTFEAAHSYDRMSDPAVVDVKNRVTLSGRTLTRGRQRFRRQGIVEVVTRDGATSQGACGSCPWIGAESYDHRRGS